MSTVSEKEQHQQAKAKILQEIYAEVNKIQDLEVLIRNNFYLHSEHSNPAVEHITDCESLHLVLKEEQGRSTLDDDNVEKQILKKLDTEKSCLELDLTRLVKLIQTKKESIFRAHTYMENIKAMVEKSHSNQNKNLRTDNILRHVQQRFKAEKQDFRLLIESLFPDNIDLQDLIAKILEHYFQEGQDKYLTLDYSDGIYELIETLIQTTLFEKHQNDDLQIKLADLL